MVVMLPVALIYVFVPETLTDGVTAGRSRAEAAGRQDGFQGWS
jgi:hypothetical protein